MIVVARVVLALVAGFLAAAAESQPLLFWVGLLLLAAAAAGATPRLGALLGILAAAVGGARAFWGGASLAFPTPGEWALVLIYLGIWAAATALLAWTWKRRRLAVLLALPVAAIAWKASHTSLTNGFDTVVGTSRYLTMRDEVRIAIDVYLPRGVKSEAGLPALVRQTRYVRSTELRWPFGLFLRAASPRRFVQAGYAVVVVDARGSGASFGSRPQEWSAGEVRDGAEVVDWIVRQPWSSGKVGATGVSYDGTASEFLLVNRHPAVKAVAPRFSLFDPYTDIAFPGGIHHTWFTSRWGRYNSALDRDAYGEILTGLPRLLVRGVKPVDEDRGRRLLAAAVAEHAANYDVHGFTLELTYKDDAAPSGLTLEAMSPSRRAAELEASGAAIYNYSGWYDGAYQFAAIRRFLAVRTSGSRLIIGPWDHGGRQNPSPYNTSTQGFDQTSELLRFFDYHLKGVPTGIETEKPVRYFTMGEEKWKSADTWPPLAEPVTYHLASGHALAQEAPREAEARDTYRVDPTAGTGNASRWNSYFNVEQVAIGYPDRAVQDEKLLTYNSAPLDSDLEITGHPVVRLFVSSTAGDGNFFAYLEEVDPAGQVRHVTEGSLRALHRKLSPPPAYASFVPYHSFRRADGQPLVPGEVAELVFDLLPTSYLVPKGHSLRLALAGADKDHCETPPGEPPTVAFYRDNAHASRLELPVVRKQSR